MFKSCNVLGVNVKFKFDTGAEDNICTVVDRKDSCMSSQQRKLKLEAFGGFQ